MLIIYIFSIKLLHEKSIISFPVKEEIDFATTHFEKVRLSKEFQTFQLTYNNCMPIYSKLMNRFVEGAPLYVVLKSFAFVNNLHI